MELVPAKTTPDAVKPAAVLFVSHALNLGGVATHMQLLGRGLLRRGIRVGVVARDLNPGAAFGLEYFRDAGFEIFPCDFSLYGLNWDNFRKTLAAITRLKDIARDFRADLLHVHAPTLCLVAHFSRLPYVSTFNISVNGKNKLRIARWVNRLSATAFGNRTIAISREMQQDLVQQIGVPPNRVRLCIYGIDDEVFAPATAEQRTAARAQFGLPHDAVVACMVASLEPRKNHSLLLDAMKVLKDRGCPVMAILAGSGWGDHVPKLQAAIAARGLNGTVLYLGQQKALPVYHASDLFVLPSFQEGFPLTVLEAMFCGLVPIRTPSEGAAEQIIDGQSGYLVPFGQPEVLADRLAGLAADVALRRQMGQAARESALAQFTAAKMVERTLDIYRECLAD